MTIQLPGYSGMEPFFRFALSHQVTTIVVGCDDLRQLEENVRFAWSFTPMVAEEVDQLALRAAAYARQLMYCKP